MENISFHFKVVHNRLGKSSAINITYRPYLLWHLSGILPIFASFMGITKEERSGGMVKVSKNRKQIVVP